MNKLIQIHMYIYTLGPIAVTLIAHSCKSAEGHFHRMKPLENEEYKGTILGDQEIMFPP